MELTSFKCPWCDFTHTNLENSLRIHAQKRHKKTSKELYDALHGEPRKCGCGCGKETKFGGLGNGYSEFCWGHHSRVENNWGHNEKALLKSQDKRREQIAAGEWQAWNKGKSAETDTRIAQNNRAISESIQSRPEELQRRSEHMKKQWEDENIVSLHGADHPRWRGGVSLLSAHCHASNKLYREWKFPKLQASGFRCSRCGKEGQDAHLCVHHDKERMADIIKRFSAAFGYEGREDQQAMKESIAEAVASYHVDNDISGVVLCDVCHKEEHPTLNFES